MLTMAGHACVWVGGNMSTSTYNFFLNPQPHIPLGYIRQVEYSASYIDGNYGIANEFGVSH
jgi:hypothetical protein